MMLFVDFTQTFPGDVSVDLRRRDIRMTQHGLHGTQVRTVFQQMSRERMTQGVG